jgi:hypothetical protein
MGCVGGVEQFRTSFGDVGADGAVGRCGVVVVDEVLPYLFDRDGEVLLDHRVDVWVKFVEDSRLAVDPLAFWWCLRGQCLDDRAASGRDACARSPAWIARWPHPAGLRRTVLVSVPGSGSSRLPRVAGCVVAVGVVARRGRAGRAAERSGCARSRLQVGRAGSGRSFLVGWQGGDASSLRWFARASLRM